MHPAGQVFPHESCYQVMGIFEAIALAAFLLLVFRDEMSIDFSRPIGLSALIAAVLLIEVGPR